MEENIDYVIEPVDDVDEEETETGIPWKPIMAAFVAGATSTATVIAVRANRRKKALAAALVEEDTDVIVGTPVPPTS